MGLGSLGSSIRFLSAFFALITLFYVRKQETVEITSAVITNTSKEQNQQSHVGNLNNAFVDEKSS